MSDLSDYVGSVTGNPIEGTVVLTYHCEDGQWWCTSPTVRYVGIGDTYDECRQRASEGVPWFLEHAVALFHVIADDSKGFA